MRVKNVRMDKLDQNEEISKVGEHLSNDKDCYTCCGAKYSEESTLIFPSFYCTLRMYHKIDYDFYGGLSNWKLVTYNYYCA